MGGQVKKAKYSNKKSHHVQMNRKSPPKHRPMGTRAKELWIRIIVLRYACAVYCQACVRGGCGGGVTVQRQASVGFPSN